MTKDIADHRPDPRSAVACLRRSGLMSRWRRRSILIAGATALALAGCSITVEYDTEVVTERGELTDGSRSECEVLTPLVSAAEDGAPAGAPGGRRWAIEVRGRDVRVEIDEATVVLVEAAGSEGIRYERHLRDDGSVAVTLFLADATEVRWRGDRLFVGGRAHRLRPACEHRLEPGGDLVVVTESGDRTVR